MSVQVADLNVFNYVYHGLMKIALNTTGDDFHCYTMQQHFKQHVENPAQEAKRLVKSWIILTEKTYDFTYRQKAEKQSLAEFMSWGFSKYKLTAVQLHKFLHCISYNISVLPSFSVQDKKDFQLLETLYKELSMAIVMHLPQWKDGNYSGFERPVIEGKPQ